MAEDFYIDQMARRRRMLPMTLGAASPNDVLTQNVQAGEAITQPMLSRSMQIRKQIADLESQDDDMSAMQAYARQQGESGQSAMLNALAAQFAGDRFEPVQAQFLKRAAAAQQPMRVGRGMVTPDGQYIVDPGARREAQLGRLSREADLADRLEAQQAAQTERLQAQAQARAAELQRKFERDQDRASYERGMLQLRGMIAASRGDAANKPPAGYRFKDDGNLEAIPGGPADTKLQGQLNADTAALNSGLSALDMLERATNEVRTHPGLPRITGLMGRVPNIPGSDAANAQAKLEQLRSQVGFAVLQAMRDASKTGGALGNVSNFELQSLQNNLAALQNAQSESQIKDELKKLQDWSVSAKDRLRSAYNMKHSGASPAVPAGAKPTGGPPPGVDAKVWNAMTPQERDLWK